MYDRLAERTRTILALARQEAQRLGHDYIGTGHLLLGLMREGNGIAAKALQRLGLDQARMWSEVEEVVSRRTEYVAPGGTFPLSPGAREAMEYALEESKRMGHTDVTPEHLLLGLLKDDEGIACEVLGDLGVAADDVRSELQDLAGAGVMESDDALPIAPSAREALAHAADEAERRGRSSIGIEDLIVGLAKQQRELAARTAGQLHRLRDEIEAALQGLQGLSELDVDRGDDEDGA
jgi:ATP-dependent Clp protease ATP-binding subunit ClpA